VRRRCGSASWRSAASSRIREDSAPYRSADEASGLVRRKEETVNIFYIIGVVVVVLFVLGYLGLR
jgi:hypothetical protein